MKKITKRIMALMLLLVMMLGCIPRNIAHATDKTVISEIVLTSGSMIPTVGEAMPNLNPVHSKQNPTSADDIFDDGISGDEGWYLTPECVGAMCTGTFQKDTSYYYKRHYKIINTEDYTYADSVSIDFIISNIDYELISDTADSEYIHTLIIKVNPSMKSYTLNGTEKLADLNIAAFFGGTLFDSYPLSGHRGVYYVVFHFTNALDLYGSIKFKGNEYISNVKTSKPSDEDIFYEKCFIINGDPGFDAYFVYDWSKEETITFTQAPGMTVADVLASVTKSSGSINSVCICPIDEGIPQEIPLENTDKLEVGKKYKLCVTLDVPGEGQFYSVIKVNNDTLTYRDDLPISVDGWNVYGSDSYLDIKYTFECKQQSSGSTSKKYKATDTKDTTEKISGTGKKGSKRTIVPEEGRKVANVVVTDKEGNEIEVTMNEDGTYSFVQPASNVNVEVTYKNREITLNIGSTIASVDGEKENLDVCPVIRNDRTMLPIRFVAENLGAKVEWSEKNPNYVVISRGNTKIEITLGSDIMKVNGSNIVLDSVAFAENDRTYLPVRAVSEALNAYVEWHENEPSVVKIFER